MARSDLLISLVQAAASGDRATVRSTTEALAADERAKNHHVLADRLNRALMTVVVSPPSLNVPSANAASGRDAIHEVTPQIELSSLQLTLPAKENARQLIEEHVRSGVLRAHGFEPRHRVLLSGPPGNGKTSFAEAIAESLALPMFVVRYDTLIGSYLGETNSRLRNLFDFVRMRPCVLFFDEFDAIGKERGDNHETGEIKRVVSFLLMQLDQLPSYVVIVAATNHAELLDRAVWRRFQIRLDFPHPSKQRLEQYLRSVIERWPIAPTLSIRRIAAGIGNVSYAEALDFCQTVRRRQILGLGDVDINDAIKIEIELWRARVRPEQLDAKRPKQAATSAVPKRASRKAKGKTEVPAKT